MKKMKALIVEDERMAQAQLTRLLESRFPDIEVVAATGSVHDTVAYQGEFRDKHLMNHLQPGSSFMSEYVIKIGE